MAAAANAVMVYPTEAIVSSGPDGDIRVIMENATALNSSSPNIDSGFSNGADVKMPASHWRVSSRPASDNGSGELETDLSSLESLQLTDSPDVTTISTVSHRSSLSSLNGIQPKPRGLNFQWPSSNKQQTTNSLLHPLSPVSGHRSSQYQELRDQLTRFASRHGPAKANYLRLSLLTFLRKHRACIVPSGSEQEYAISVLSAWLDQLLIDLNSGQKQVSGSDRNAYYEAISELMARPEWLDHQDKPLYQSLLRRSLIHVFSKSTILPHMPVAQAAFMGKLMAYGYFHIPGFAPYLLSRLNIKNSTVRRIVNAITRKSHPNIGKCLSGVPDHLSGLVNATRVPPWMPVPEWLRHIPESTWLRHWLVESILFASFIKHFCSLQTQYFPIMNPLGVGSTEEEDVDAADDLMLAAPGMILLLSALVENLDDVVHQHSRALGTRSGNPYARRPGSVGPNSLPGRVRIDQIKCFTAFREVLHSDETTILYFTSFSRAFDCVLRVIALNTEVYDMDSCVTVCDLAEEWMSSIFLVPAPKSEQHILANHYRIINWEFWLNVARQMLKSDNSHTEIRALSFLFNIWNNLPGYCRGPPVDSSILKAATDWLLSPEIFLQLFCHWSPLVRSYYHRILCFRVASVGLDTDCWFLDVDSSEYYAESRQVLSTRISSMLSWCNNLKILTDMVPAQTPSLPVPRLRIAIRPNAAQHNAAQRLESGLNRLYPFDIFDNAAYWLPEPAIPETKGLQRQSSVSSRASAQTVGSRMSATSAVSGLSAATFSSDLSGSSLASNDSDRSGISVATDSSRLSRSSRLSFTSLSAIIGTAKSAPPDEDVDGLAVGDSAAPEKSASSGGGISTIVKRRWPSIRDLLSGKGLYKTKSDGEMGEAEPVVLSEATDKSILSPPTGEKSAKAVKRESKKKKAERRRAVKINRKREQHEAAQAIVPLPPQLAELRPEIVRSPHRFVLIPVNGNPSPIRGDAQSPRLPFSPAVEARGPSDLAGFRQEAMDLTVWNYGFKSLAEWNVVVSMFECFAAQENKHANGNIEMLQAPFLVAEIPWRALG